MRLFLFSASVFYLLGLKLTSQIEIRPLFHHKPAQIETKTIPVPQPDIQEKSATTKKDTLHSPESKKTGQASTTGKKTEEAGGQLRSKV
ncbi:MAG: hypothetical protein JNL03_01710 [Prolixibacteraceae bacterium]|nr:hypothetical protein [Prolixibacteraceae bacterium]